MQEISNRRFKPTTRLRMDIAHEDNGTEEVLKVNKELVIIFHCTKSTHKNGKQNETVLRLHSLCLVKEVWGWGQRIFPKGAKYFNIPHNSYRIF